MKPSLPSHPPIRSTNFQASPARSILTCAVLLGTAALASADTKLRGNVGPRTIDDDVVIARGSSCTLNGTIIKGNIRVQSGAKLVTHAARITGNLQAYKAYLVEGSTELE
jgi:hypothetical protein